MEPVGSRSGSVRSRDSVGSMVRSRGESFLVHGAPTPEEDTPPDIGMSSFGAVFTVMNATLGAALLSFPYATSLAGGIASLLFMQYLVVAFAGGGLIVLAYCADVGGASVYQEVVRTMTNSELWKAAVEVVIMTYAFGSCVAYLVLVGDQGQEILHAMIGDATYEEHAELYRKLVILVLSVLVVLPLIMPKNISFLALPSIACTFSVFFVVICIVIMFFLNSQENIVIETKPTTWENIFNVLPTVAFGYQAHVSGVPVYCALKERTISNWLRIVAAAELICSLIYSVTGIFGYLSFGTITCDDILLNYAYDNPLICVARFAIMMAVLTSYPLIHFCGRMCLEDISRRVLKLDPEQGKRTWTTRYYVQTISWFILSLIGALFIPGINKVINIIGAFAAFFILGFPGICFFRLALGRMDAERQADRDINAEIYTEKKRRIDLLLLLLGGLYMVFCAFLFGSAFASGVQNLIGRSAVPPVQNDRCN